MASPFKVVYKVSQPPGNITLDAARLQKGLEIMDKVLNHCLYYNTKTNLAVQSSMIKCPSSKDEVERKVQSKSPKTLSVFSQQKDHDR